MQAGAVEGAWRWGAPAHAALLGRMDLFADTLQRLREAFDSGCTRPAEFRAAQLKGLSRFLQENKQLLQEALAQDLHKVGCGGTGRGGRRRAGVGRLRQGGWGQLHPP